MAGAPLFARRTTAMTPPYLPEEAKPRDQYDPMGQGQQRRPGLFGRIGNVLRRADWDRIAAAMRDDPVHMQMLMAQRQDAAEAARREAEAQALMRMRQMQSDREYKQDIRDQNAYEARPGMTHTTRIDPATGEVILGGELPLRPYAPRSGAGGEAQDDGWTYYD